MKKGRATTNPYAEEINAGVKWLDRKVGKDWVMRINLYRLHMSNCFQCILGQVFGNFHSESCDMTYRKAGERGFTAKSFTGFPVLGDAWKRRITQLRKARAK